MISIKNERLYLILALFIAIFVFVKNAWVCEDAYIVFRSIEQLFAGNGPRWNPHERVQVFTSPLWFWVLSFGRLFTKDAYLNAMVISFTLWLATVYTLKRLFDNGIILICCLLFLASSNAFFDFTCSGLENVLAYLVIALYLHLYIDTFSPKNSGAASPEMLTRNISLLTAILGVTICIRHDLCLLLLPPTFHALIALPPNSTHRRRAYKHLALAMLPFMAWSLFALLYYGTPFPNTAYAKLNTGLSRSELLQQGVLYYRMSILMDTITLVIISIALIAALFSKTSARLRHLSYGIVIHLIYTLFVGGDFMQGRFFSYPYFISVVILLSALKEKVQSGSGLSIKISPTISQNIPLAISPAYYIALLIPLAYTLTYHHTPFNSSPFYAYNTGIDKVSDERGLFFPEASLMAYLTRDKTTDIFPYHHWSTAGVKYKELPLTVFKNIGFYGYWSGTDKIIIDPLALSDPLLARLPAISSIMAGHYPRQIPAGYVNSIKTGTTLIEDRNINEFYKVIRLVTQSEDLFAKERIKAILLLNTGAYNHLLRNYTQKSAPQNP